MNRDLFNELFILELANNHWGRVERGLEIIEQYSRIVRFNNVRAAIKFQMRDVDTFIHKDFRHRKDIRYIRKTQDTQMPLEHFAKMVEAAHRAGCVAMATPFDEKSVDNCVNLGIQIFKVASSDINDWFLLERLAAARRPVVVSTGGSSEKDVDDMVAFFENRNIPLAIMHCVSIYPSEDGELDLNQIDYLRNRFPNHDIGLSSHEYHDWHSSMLISYAKGARIWERHVDIDDGTVSVSPYCSLPHQLDQWFKAFKKAKEMCGDPGTQKRIPPEKEIRYLDALVRGVYARRDLPAGYALSQAHIEEDLYLAVPLQKGQISCRELMSGEKLLQPVRQDEPLMIDDIESPYAHDEDLKKVIYSRGLEADLVKNLVS